MPGGQVMSRLDLPHVIYDPTTQFQLEFTGLPRDGQLTQTAISRFPAAFEAMRQLERGAIANPDEQRMVGHYWLRDSSLAPTPQIKQAIEETLVRVKRFAAEVHSGTIGPRPGARFTQLLHIGIGGSALGPQLAADCLGTCDDKLQVEFLDNTDPEGIARAFLRLGQRLATTIVIVASKSGGTPETRNGMLEAIARLKALGCNPAQHLVAITAEGSALERLAREDRWLAIFPMWDWVGGRTSQTSAVGLLPMALLGHDLDAFLAGARAMDQATRTESVASNPAARLALAWYVATSGRGERAMVVLPYRDRLLLMSRYLQQLVMESLGKQFDLAGREVEQGIAVYGNKGSTDQHAYVQQLRDGTADFFATFITSSCDNAPDANQEVEPGITCGDYLISFMLGTRRALMEKGRPCLSINIPVVDASTLGSLIALFERSVGLYAALINVNAYHQPGVEAGKRAAAAMLTLQQELTLALRAEPGTLRTAAQWAASIGKHEFEFEAGRLLDHLASTARRGVKRAGSAGAPDARFGC
jgi:glucose-6-phosphate isomerase